MMKPLLSIGVLAISLCCSALHAVGTPGYDAFTYQGQLNQGGTPVVGPINLAFRLYDAASGGAQVGTEIAAIGFDQFDDEGRFTIDLNFGTSVFDGAPLWLEVLVAGGPLAPRQPLMPAPYAIRALAVNTVGNAALVGSYTNALSMTNATNQFTGTFTGTGSALTGLNAANLASGTVPSARISGTYSSALTLSNASNSISGVFAGNGAGLSGLNASNLATGTVPSARLSGTYSSALTLSNASNSISGLFAGNGAGLSGLNASNLATGTVPSARLSGTYSSALTLLNASNSFAGSGAGLTSLNAANIATGNLNVARLPTGGSWSLSSNLYIGDELFRVLPSNGSVTIGASGIEASSRLLVEGDAVDDRAVRALAPQWGGQFIATSTTGTNYGVWGQTSSPSGFAGYFSGPAGSRSYFERPVGIGTTAPQSELHVTGVGGNADLRLQASGATNSFNFGVSSTPKLFIASHDGTSFSDRVTVDGPTGRVGIGTSNPADLLSVAGTANVTGPMSIGVVGADARLVVRGVTGEDAFRVRVENSTKLVVKDNGGVGIGSNFGEVFDNGLIVAGSGGFGLSTIGGTGGFTLSVSGNAGKTGGGLWASFSDQRLKRDIEPIEPGMLDRLLTLNGYTFEFVADAIERRLAAPGRQIGLIAQEVQQVFPDWVDADDEGYLFVSERGLTAIMVEAIRELRTEKDAENAALQTENAELRSRLATIEHLLGIAE